MTRKERIATFLRDISLWRKEESKNPPIFLKYRSSSIFIIGTISIAVFTDIFLYSVIVPVIPFALTNRAGVRSEDVQHWVSVLLAVYGAALLAASPLCGFLADKTPSRRLPLLLGLLALGGSTLLLCLGNSLALLILGRTLQGISAAMVWTVGLALLADTVGPEKIGQAVGYVSISMSGAILIGPLLGGVVYAKEGYFSVYYMAFGMIILDILLRVFLVEKKVARKWTSASPVPMSDKPAIKTPRATVPLPTSTASSAPAPTVDPPLAILSAESTKSSRRPAFFTLLTSRRLLAALFCTVAQSILMTSWDAVLPLYTHRLFNFSSLGAGLIFLPLIIPSFLAPLVGWWADKRGSRTPTTLGFFLVVPPIICLRYVNHSGMSQIVLLCALLALVGVAITNAMTPLLAEITYIVVRKEEEHPGAFGGKGVYATAYGIFNTAFAGGMLAGPLWAGFVVSRAGWGTMCWSLAVLSVGGGVVSFVWVGGWVGKRRVGRGGVGEGGKEGGEGEDGGGGVGGVDGGKGEVVDGGGGGVGGGGFEVEDAVSAGGREKGEGKG